MKEWMVGGWFQKKGWNPWPHGLLGNPPLSPELCALVARWNVLSAGGRTLSFKRGLRKTHCPANQHLNWSVFTLTFTIAATDTSPTLDCVKCEIVHLYNIYKACLPFSVCTCAPPLLTQLCQRCSSCNGSCVRVYLSRDGFTPLFLQFYSLSTNLPALNEQEIKL